MGLEFLQIPCKSSGRGWLLPRAFSGTDIQLSAEAGGWPPSPVFAQTPDRQRVYIQPSVEAVGWPPSPCFRLTGPVPESRQRPSAGLNAANIYLPGELDVKGHAGLCTNSCSGSSSSRPPRLAHSMGTYRRSSPVRRDQADGGSHSHSGLPIGRGWLHVRPGDQAGGP